MTKIMCKTMRVTSPRENVIKVEVNNLANSYYLTHFEYKWDGQTLSHGRIFSFVIPKVIDFYPRYGPYSGGTNITIRGEHLLAGSSKYILVAGMMCKEYDATDNVTHCTSTGIMNNNENNKAINCTTDSIQYNTNKAIPCTTGLIAPQSSSSVASIAGPVIIHIDRAAIKVLDSVGNETLFTYKPDPVVNKIFPRNSIISGGVILNISGNHLDSIAYPRIVVIPEVNQSVDVLKFEQSCEVISQFEMSCVAPNLSVIHNRPDFKAPLIANISFIMDGVNSLRDLAQKNQMLSRFVYYPDPVYFEFFNGIKKIGIIEKILRIEGKYLNLSQSKRDVKVIIDGNKTCEVHEISETYLLCNLPRQLENSAGNTFKVEVMPGNLYYNVGYIQFFNDTSANFVILIIVTIALLILLAFVIIGCIWRHRTNSQTDIELTSPIYKNIRINGDHNLNRKNSRQAAVHRKRNEETRRLLEAENILLSPEHLEIGKIIGKGHFGCVFKGILRLPGQEIGNDVAIKTINNDHTEEIDMVEFLREALIMKDFHHSNVLTLVGVCFQNDGQPTVITPLLMNGDLLSYIRSEVNRPSMKDLINFGIQIAEGMKYLAELKFVHRDLAARNCLLDEDLTVKVADFGLTRDIYESVYYKIKNKNLKLPVKWMALESLEQFQFSLKSDVWSYGVVLWELITRGGFPYAGVGAWDVVQFLRSGRRLSQPSQCPNSLYQIMRRCWLEDSHQRPTFSELVDEMKEFELNVVYINDPVNSDDSSDLSEIEETGAVVS